MMTSQSMHSCLRREVPADHEAQKPNQGWLQRRQLRECDDRTLERRDDSQLPRDRDPEDEAEHAKHGRIRTQADHQRRMTSVLGEPEQPSSGVTIASTLRLSAKSGPERMAT